MYEVPTPEKLRAFMIENNLTGADIAALTGVNPRTARRWVGSQDQKGARPIPWSDWALLLLLTGKTTVESLLNEISKWKAQKTTRGLFERGVGGRPVSEIDLKK